MEHQDPLTLSTSPWFGSVIMGGVLALLGLFIGAHITITTIGAGYELFWLWAGLSAFICGAVFWRLLAAHKPGPVQGSLAGLLAGVVSHWLCWWLFITSAWVSHLFTGQLSSLGEPPMNPINALWGAAAFSFWSLIVAGWITAPAGAFTGWALGRVWRKTDPKA